MNGRTRELLHILWGLAVDTPGYNKLEWAELDSLVEDSYEKSKAMQKCLSIVLKPRKQ